MSFLSWLTDPLHWSGAQGIPFRTLQHIALTAAAMGIAALIGLPIGVLIGHSRKGTAIVATIAGASRAIPTLGLLTILALVFGIGLKAPFISLVVLAIPSILAGTYAGIQALDRKMVTAAQAIGMSPTQIVFQVELPLALPVIVGGLRAATLQVVATATLAAYTADFGLGRYLFAGLKSRDYPQMLAGAVLVATLALVLEILLASCQRLSRPPQEKVKNHE